MDVETFAPLVRLAEVLREKELLRGITGRESIELMHNRLEALIVSLEVFFFKEQLSIEDFVSLLTNLYNLADRLGVPLDRFPAYITELKDGIDVLRKEIEQLETKKQDTIKRCGMTLELIQEYNANKPFIVQLQNLKQQVADKEEKFHELERYLANEMHWNQLEEQYTWTISENELEKVNIKLNLSGHANTDKKQSLSTSNLKDMVVDVIDHPSRYVEAIRHMMDTYNFQHKGKGASTT